MVDSLIARIAALGLAGLVVMSLFSSIDRLAVHEHAATALAQGRQTPALVAAGELPLRAQRLAASAPLATPL